jgi:hypothetical protein
MGKNTRIIHQHIVPPGVGIPKLTWHVLGLRDGFNDLTGAPFTYHSAQGHRWRRRSTSTKWISPDSMQMCKSSSWSHQIIGSWVSDLPERFGISRTMNHLGIKITLENKPSCSLWAGIELSQLKECSEFSFLCRFFFAGGFFASRCAFHVTQIRPACRCQTVQIRPQTRRPSWRDPHPATAQP